MPRPPLSGSRPPAAGLARPVALTCLCQAMACVGQKGRRRSPIEVVRGAVPTLHRRSATNGPATTAGGASRARGRKRARSPVGATDPPKPLRGFTTNARQGIAHLLRKSQLFLAKRACQALAGHFSQFFVLSSYPLSTVEFFPVEDKKEGGESHNTIIILCLQGKLTFSCSPNIHQLSDKHSPAQ